jgi:hypothetical protein
MCQDKIANIWDVNRQHFIPKSEFIFSRFSSNNVRHWFQEMLRDLGNLTWYWRAMESIFSVQFNTIHHSPVRKTVLCSSSQSVPFLCWRESCQTPMLLDPVTAWHAATFCCHTTERQNCSEMQYIILYSRNFGLAFVHQVLSFELVCFGSYLSPNITTFVGLINPGLCIGILRVGWM